MRWGRNRDYERGIAHFNRGEFESAAQCFERALVRLRNPGHPDFGLARCYAAEARAHLGLAFFHAGEYPRAEREMTRALETNPSFPDLLYYRARIRERSGRVREALDDLERALHDRPGAIEIHLLAAVCRSRLDDGRGAEQALQAALALGWSGPPERLPARGATADRMGLSPPRRWRAARGAEQESGAAATPAGAALVALRREVEDATGFADRRYRLGQALMDAGRPAEAARELDQALRLNPRYLEARVLAARARMECGEARRAADDLEIAVGQEPRYADLHFWLGLARFRAGNFEGAAASLETAVGLNREFGRAQRLLGLVYHALGRGPDALRALRRGMARDRELARAGLGVAPLLEEQGGGAESRLRRALALQPGYPDLHFALARLLAARGDPEGARDACRKALALKPDYDAAAVELAKAELALGSTRNAEVVLEPLVLRRTQWADVHALLGRTRLLRGDAENAEASLRAAVLLNPSYAAARADLGWALLAQGRSREADEEFARALELDPLNALPRQQLEWRELMAAKGEGAA